MKNYVCGLLAGTAALLAATSASASPPDSAGHYEWRLGVQAPGPRAPLAVSRRIWVPAPMAMDRGSACSDKMRSASSTYPKQCCDAFKS
jgi:hypothetical protein